MNNLFEYYIKDELFHLKYAKGKPSLTGREFHNYDEIVFFINGTANFISANIQKELQNGYVAVIPKEHFHQFCVKDCEQYIRCIIGFHNIPELNPLIEQVMDSVKIIVNPNEKIISVFKDLMEIAKSNLSECEKKLYLKSALTHILIYLKSTRYEAILNKQTLSDTVIGALNIIDEHYSSSLSIRDIAKKLHTSPSSLAHKFSQELNIPIYRYISKKRLSEAHKRIENGETNIQAATNSGFSDYSCFYRLYKKYYLSDNKK